MGVIANGFVGSLRKMKPQDNLLPEKSAIALAIGLLILAVLTKSLLLVFLSVASLMIRLPIPRTQRVLYIGIYFCLATMGLLVIAAIQGSLDASTYVTAATLSVLGVFGIAAYFYRKKQPDKNPDLRG